MKKLLAWLLSLQAQGFEEVTIAEVIAHIPTRPARKPTDNTDAALKRESLTE